MMTYTWIFKQPPQKENVISLQEELNVSETIATLLAQRGITTFDKAKHFFRPSLDDLYPPYLMKDMEKAVSRIHKAIENQENILIYGDYDVDGTTAVALMYLFLQQFTHNIDFYIPDRYSEGYGISFQGIDYASDNDFSLIIALDCGIKAIDKVAYANGKGIDFIICDHHRPSEIVPDALAILNPKQVDCSYPYKELCGCGVGFKLIQALNEHWGYPFENILPFLDLVATAIAADIVPITDENRVLMYFGLEILNKNPRVGIKALLGDDKTVETSRVVFRLAPRINAAGRIEHGKFAVKLLTECDKEKALEKAKIIEKFNTERKELDQSIVDEALAQIEKNEEQHRFTTVVYAPSWHKGVIGIVASRLIETYHRPTLVFTKSGEKYAASARSVSGFDVYEALEQCADYIEQFGGHKYAAGLTILPEKYPLFKEKFEEVVSKTITKDLLERKIIIDTILPLGQITDKMFDILKQFEPLGPRNMTPVFYAENVVDTGVARAMGKNGEHLRLTLKEYGRSRFFTATAFNMAHMLPTIKQGKPFKIVYSLEENFWNGEADLQLMVRDIKF